MSGSPPQLVAATTTAPPSGAIASRRALTRRHVLVRTPLLAARRLEVRRRRALVGRHHEHAAVAARLEGRDARAAADAGDRRRRAPVAAAGPAGPAQGIGRALAPLAQPDGRELAVGRLHGHARLGLEDRRCRCRGSRSRPSHHRAAGRTPGPRRPRATRSRSCRRCPSPHPGPRPCRARRASRRAATPAPRAPAPEPRSRNASASTRSESPPEGHRVRLSRSRRRNANAAYVSGPACACVQSDGKPWEYDQPDGSGGITVTGMPRAWMRLGSVWRCQCSWCSGGVQSRISSHSPRSTSVADRRCGVRRRSPRGSPAGRRRRAATSSSASSGVQSGASGWRSGGTMSAIWQPACARCLTSSSNRGADSVRLATTSSRRDEGSVMALMTPRRERSARHLDRMKRSAPATSSRPAGCLPSTRLMARTLHLIVALLLVAALMPAAALAGGPAATRAALASQMRSAGSGSGAFAMDLDSGRTIYCLARRHRAHPGVRREALHDLRRADALRRRRAT